MGVSTLEHLTLRREQPSDRAAIGSVNDAAFGRPDESHLIDQLRTEGAVLASFVAEEEERIVGHVLFSRMLIETADAPMPAVALAPMAVLPKRQGHGIGGRLIGHGLEWLRGRGERIVLVLGH